MLLDLSIKCVLNSKTGEMVVISYLSLYVLEFECFEKSQLDPCKLKLFFFSLYFNEVTIKWLTSDRTYPREGPYDQYNMCVSSQPYISI